MKTKSSLLTLMSLCCLHAFAQSSWTNYTNDRLIDDVLVVNDDVWVCSQGGLTRTNLQTGEFQSYLAGNSPIMGGGITEIEKAPDNSLWMASEEAGIFHLKNDTWTNYYTGVISSPYYEITNLQVLPNSDVWVSVRYQKVTTLIRIIDGVVDTFGNLPKNLRSCAVLDEQTIFVANSDTLYRYDAIQEKVLEMYHAGNSIISPQPRLTEIITDRNGALIIPTEHNILQLKNGTLSVLSTPGIGSYKAFKDAAGNVYFSTYTNEPNGIRLLKYDGLSVTYIKDVDLEPYPADDVPHFKGIDNEGRLFAVIWNLDTEYTLFRYDDNAWTPIKTQIYPMLDNYQDDVQADCEGNLWFGSRDGVDVRYADGSWEHFPIEVSPFTYFRVGSMTVDPITCDVWFTNTSNGGSPSIPGLIRISNGIVTPFLLGHSNVHDVEAAADGKVYFMSLNSGFGYIENDEIHYIDQLAEFDFATSIDSDSKGNVYIAAWDDKLYAYDGSNLLPLAPEEFNAVVYGVYVDNEDAVWVNFSGGVKLYDGANWTDYSTIWPVNTYNGMVQDRKGNYWVSTWHDGLYYWDKHTLQNYNIFNSGLSTNSLRSVALDPEGNLIVTQQVGASVLDIPAITNTYRGSGTVFFDAEKDGVFNQENDVLVPGQKVKDTDRNLWAVTNSYGKYTFYGDAPGTYQFLHELQPTAESTTDNPQSGAFTNFNSPFPDFGYWQPNIPEVDVNIANGVPVCNRDFRVHILLRNKSPYATLGHFVLHFNDQLTLIQSSIPYSQLSAGQIIFEDLTIEPLGILVITLDFTAPGFTTEGIALFFNGIYSTSDGVYEGITLDTVVCSYDPNDKKVEATGDFIDDYSLIADPLKYTIRFQNEGTYKAFDITIIDTLDQHLDPTTFEFLASSHDVEVTITGDGIITFVFRNIDLPTRSDDDLGSQGFVTFTVKPDHELTGLESIRNKASIYFDFNPPIVTNTAHWHVVDDLAIVSTKEVHAHMSVYPNPTQGTLYLTIDKEADYTIWDCAGRHVDAGILQPGSNSIHLDVPYGIYYLQVRDGDQVFAPVKVAVIR